MIPTYTIVARALADMRVRCWSSSQLVMLDMAVDAIADGLAEVNPKFDTELFRVRSKYQFHRLLEETQ